MLTLSGALSLTEPAEAPLSTLTLVGSLGALVLAACGFLAGASLIAYSPTRLGRRAPPGLVADLEAHGLEYQTVARVLSIGGVVTSFLLAAETVAGVAGTFLVVAVVILAVFLCAVLPGAVAERHAEAVVRITVPVLRVLRTLLRYPVILPLLGLARALLAVVPREREAPLATEELAQEIVEAVEETSAETPIQAEGREWIGNIVELQAARVADAMTPRPEIVAFEASTPLRQAVQMAVEAGYSRLPVFDGGIDNVVGVFVAKDALGRVLGRSEALDAPVRASMRPPMFVPESMPAVDLLRHFRSQRVQMAIVLDEFGGTAGLITLEDLLEEIVGEIEDEHDLGEDRQIHVVEPERIAEVAGRSRIAEVNEALHLQLPEDGDYDTIAGFVFARLGRIPNQGETFQAEGAEFRILAADQRRIRRLRIRVLQPEPSDAPK
ncbi:MAG: HlyC/CorC family transporter [Planctomycetes bacterium]|nr:HlyC/CorC family transporter [Planctomycetota bacterium]